MNKQTNKKKKPECLPVQVELIMVIYTMEHYSMKKEMLIHTDTKISLSHNE